MGEAMQRGKKNEADTAGFKWSFNGGDDQSDNIGGFESLLTTDAKGKHDAFKFTTTANNDADSDSDSPPPLDAEDQRKLMATKKQIQKESGKQSSWSWSLS